MKLTFSGADDFFFLWPPLELAFDLGPSTLIGPLRPGIEAAAAAAAAALTTLCFRISLSGLSLNSVRLPRAAMLADLVVPGGGINGKSGLEKMPPPPPLSFEIGNFGAVCPPEHPVD